MRWLAIAVAAVVVIALVVTAIGWWLPQGHVASRQAVLATPPEVVWQAITDVDAFPAWRSGVTRIERRPDTAGRAAWVEHGKDGAIPMVVERAEPPTRLVVRIADAGLPFGGTWTYELAPVPTGTRVTITERGEVYNPVFRFVSRFVFGHEATLAQYLTDLHGKVEGER
jgi:uncharacterized protein YndB with AHSA1/START domain